MSFAEKMYRTPDSSLAGIKYGDKRLPIDVPRNPLEIPISRQKQRFNARRCVETTIDSLRDRIVTYVVIAKLVES